MIFGGRKTIIRAMSILAATLLMVLPFQNCGSEYGAERSSLYVGDEYGSDDCLSELVDCGPRVEFLQISIDLANPLVVSGSTFNLIGRCNSGNYEIHSIAYEIRTPTGTVLRQDEVASACVNGRYQIPLDLTGVVAGQLYSAYATIYGYDSDGLRYGNQQTNGFAEIDFNK